MLENLAEALTPASIPDADAAVCLLLKTTGEALSVLLVVRAKNPDDPWSGQTALPGGKHSSEDQNLKQTVAREVLEETGIDLAGSSRFVGVLPTQQSLRGPELHVLPFIYLIGCEPLVELNSELQDFVWVQVDELPQCRTSVNLGFGQLPAFAIKDNIIWGLTYRILESLLKAIQMASEGPANDIASH